MDPNTDALETDIVTDLITGTTKLVTTPVTQRQPARQRTTNATEINKQSKGVNICLGTTCNRSL